MQPGDWINITGIIVNAFLAIWIVNVIQSKASNRRVLKDHFISEVISYREEYKKFIQELSASSVNSREVLPWFKLMNVKINDTLDVLNTKYDVNKYVLQPYQIQLPDLITNSPDFIATYGASVNVILSDATKIALTQFQQNFNNLFLKLIVDINDN